MKAFVLSLLLFIIILLAVLLHGQYVTHVSEHLLSYTARLKSHENIADTISELSAFWKKSEAILRWTSRQKELKCIREAILGLRVSFEQEDSLGFAYRVEQLSDLAEELTKFERLHFFLPSGVKVGTSVTV